MKLKVNGVLREYPGNVQTVHDLLSLPEWLGRQVIVERNGEVIGKPCWGETRLTDSDVLELVHFVGGG